MTSIDVHKLINEPITNMSTLKKYDLLEEPGDLYIVGISAVIDILSSSEIQVRARSSDEAGRLAKELIDDNPSELDWEFMDMSTIDPESIGELNIISITKQ